MADQATPQQPAPQDGQTGASQPQQPAQPTQPAQPAQPAPAAPQPAAPAPDQPAPAQSMPQAPADPAAAPAQEPEDTTPANFQLGTMLPAELKVPVPKHELNFDQNHFLRLLAGSISLSRDEKKRIIESIPKLKQAQIDELIRIFEEEKFKFSQLSAKHVPQLEKLAKQHHQDWIDLEQSYVAQEKAKQDESEADEIRKSLGI